jgi:hypothetical protein
MVSAVLPQTDPRMLIPVAYAQDATDPLAVLSSAGQFLPLVLIFGVFYFLWIRPRQQKRKPWAAISTSGIEPGQVTRLLCASAFLGTFLGPLTFRYKMIRFFQSDTRATAPELGFDARLVLLACQVAHRRAQRYTILFAGVALLTLVLEYGVGPGAFVAGVVLSWVVCYFKMVQERATLIRPFRRDAFDTTTIAGSFGDRSLDKRLAEALPSENQNLLVYASFLPFVGAGIDWGGWSFSTFVDKAKADAAERATIPFTIEELYAAVDTEIANLNIPMLRAEDWYFANGIDVRDNKDILRDVAARPTQRLPPEVAAAHLRANDRQVRHYKWIRIEDWGGDLVVSYFLRCARLGESLFVEARQFLLPPLAAKYRGIDSLPERGAALHVTCLLEALVTGPAILVAAPFLTLIMALNTLAKRLVGEERRSRCLRRAMERVTQHNYGAVTSLRVSLAQSSFLHYFQRSDADLYRKVLERKLLDCIIAFLDAHDIDTSDIRERRTTIINSGIFVQRGDVHAGSLAVGYGATATKIEGTQADRAS